jgi:hypothetical protein
MIFLIPIVQMHVKTKAYAKNSWVLKKDVRPFIKDLREIELWSKEFFVAVVKNTQCIKPNDDTSIISEQNL